MVTTLRFTTLIRAVALIALLAPPAWAATSVKSGKSNSSDRIIAKLVTASTNVSAPSDTQTVYTTPATGDFILTQVCVGAANGGIQVSAASLGTVALVAPGTCERFEGMIMPASSAITCSTGADAAEGTYFCTISGLLSPPPVIFR